MVEVRDAHLSDAPRLLEIYDWYVRHTAITFEYDTPSLSEFSARMERTMERWPWLVILRDGVIQGYAYAGPLKDRAAYDWCCELSIYLDRSARGAGLGRRLYGALEAALGRMGLCSLYACIALPEGDDEYLDHCSADFHAHLGFVTVGTFRLSGYKFHRWYHMIWMEKVIAPRQGEMSPVQPWPACPREGLWNNS